MLRYISENWAEKSRILFVNLARKILHQAYWDLTSYNVAIVIKGYKDYKAPSTKDHPGRRMDPFADDPNYELDRLM